MILSFSFLNYAKINCKTMLSSIFSVISFVVIALIAVAMIVVTLSLNTKSEGLGAAITGGAGDAYRGAVGVEEKKRRLLRRLGYTFLIVTLLFALFYRGL